MARRPRRSRRVRFRSHRGARSHGGSVFRSHKGGYPRQKAFAAHAKRAIRVAKVRAAKLAKTPRATAFKGIGTRNPYPAKAKAAAFKSALPSAPAAWKAKKRRVAKYKAVRPKGL